MGMWNPWRGCRRVSEGCKYCFIHEGDKKRAVDTSKIEKTAQFAKSIYQKSVRFTKTGFASFIREANPVFIFITK